MMMPVQKKIALDPNNRGKASLPLAMENPLLCIREWGGAKLKRVDGIS